MADPFGIENFEGVSREGDAFFVGRVKIYHYRDGDGELG